MTIPPATLRADDAILRGGPLTVEDWRALPEDGFRHELIDGVLVMSPVPRRRHQDIVLATGSLLKTAAPRELKVLIAPAAVVRRPAMAIEPDVVVGRRRDIGELAEVPHPVLAVEAASPSTRGFDLGRKKEFLAQIDCPHYWTIEPDAGPELTVWRLEAGVYVVEAVVTGDESWTANAPFPVTVRPIDLLDD